MKAFKSILAVFLALILVGCSQAGQAQTNNEAEEIKEATGVTGTFSGTAKGYGGDVTVNLTFEDGKLVDVTGEGANETEGKGDNHQG